MIVPNPQGQTWELWTEALISYNPSIVTVVAPSLAWQEFGNRLTRVFAETPRTSFFVEWQPWAQALRTTAGG